YTSIGRICTDVLPFVLLSRLRKIVSAIAVPCDGELGSGCPSTTDCPLSRKLSMPLPSGCCTAISTSPTIIRPVAGGSFNCSCGGGTVVEVRCLGVVGRSIELLFLTEATSELDDNLSRTSSV